MTPFDDRLPEEQEPQYEELVRLLQHAYRTPVTVDQVTQEQILARVRERLGFTGGEQVGVIDSIPQRFEGTVVPHKNRLLTLIAAVVILGLLLTPLWLYFRSQMSSTAEPPTKTVPIGQLGTPITIRDRNPAVEMSMRMTSGPYFLNEMLEVEFTLTNKSQTFYHLPVSPPVRDGETAHQMIVTPNTPCELPLYVNLRGGTNTSDTSLATNILQLCKPAFSGGVPLAPNQTIHLQRYGVLTRSGHTTLITTITIGVGGNYLTTNGPSLQLVVDPNIPSQRIISGSFPGTPGTGVAVVAPPAARSQLLYFDQFTCVGTNGSSSYGTDYWTPLESMQLQAPPNPSCRVSYVVGAPGYSTMEISGTYP